jgi:cytochrome c oxidase assembly protein subunit 15/protoheme IX farnesyltransferase
MYITAVLIVWLAVVALRRGIARSTAWILLAVLFVQIVVGALNVWLEEYEALIVLHLGLGTALWMASSWFTMQLYPVAQAAPAGERHRELVTA